MVLDNSGSMHFDDIPVDPVTKAVPTNAVQRMAGLKNAAKSFMGIMETAVGPQPQDGSVDLVVRTGMINQLCPTFASCKYLAERDRTTDS